MSDGVEAKCQQDDMSVRGGKKICQITIQAEKLIIRPFCLCQPLIFICELQKKTKIPMKPSLLLFTITILLFFVLFFLLNEHVLWRSVAVTNALFSFFFSLSRARSTPARHMPLYFFSFKKSEIDFAKEQKRVVAASAMCVEVARRVDA